jgi:hypothetical protein
MTPGYFTLFTMGMSRPFSCITSSGTQSLLEKGIVWIFPSMISCSSVHTTTSLQWGNYNSNSSYSGPVCHIMSKTFSTSKNTAAANILSRVWMTTDGVWIGNLICWQVQLQVTIALSLIHTLYNSLQHILSILSLLCLHQSLPDNGFQRHMFPVFWVLELSPCLSFQLLTATAHNDWTPVLWQTHQPFTSLYCNAYARTCTNTHTHTVSLIVMVITSQHGSHRKHSFCFCSIHTC